MPGCASRRQRARQSLSSNRCAQAGSVCIGQVVDGMKFIGSSSPTVGYQPM
jgi:hypothetical protein